MSCVKVVGNVPRRKKTLSYVDPDTGNVYEFKPGKPKNEHKKIGHVPTKSKHNHIYRVRKSGSVVEVPVRSHNRKGTGGVKHHKRHVHR